MKKEEKLKRIMEVATNGGYRPRFPVAVWFDDKFNYIGTLAYKDYNVFLFSHDFAKAVFGEESTLGDEFNPKDLPDTYKMYLYHLQQAVISKDPIDYYFKHIDGNNNTNNSAND